MTISATLTPHTQHKHKTSLCKTDAPIFRQRFELSLHQENKLLKCELLTKGQCCCDTSSLIITDNAILGKCEIDIGTMGLDWTYKEWYPLKDRLS